MSFYVRYYFSSPFCEGETLDSEMLSNLLKVTELVKWSSWNSKSVQFQISVSEPQYYVV